MPRASESLEILGLFVAYVILIFVVAFVRQMWKTRREWWSNRPRKRH